MAVDLKHIQPSPVTFTHRIVEGFRDPSWTKVWLLRRCYTGDVMPTGYGFAWMDPYRDADILMPIPLNLIAQFCRWAYIGLRRKHFKDHIERAYLAGVERGRMEMRQNRAADRPHR